uniref:Uncharacterized protein n=1 Tax=Anguilla anguilla TaxID=7936 RepID=A0A0E9WT03_ANGAN
MIDQLELPIKKESWLSELPAIFCPNVTVLLVRFTALVYPPPWDVPC